MKNVWDVRRWATKVQAACNILHDAERRLVTSQLQLEQAEQTNALRYVARYQMEVELARTHAELTENQLKELTGCPTPHEAFELLVDVGVRIEAADETYQTWRTALAARERLVHAQLNQNEISDVDLVNAEQYCESTAAQYQCAVGLLLSCLPLNARME